MFFEMISQRSPVPTPRQKRRSLNNKVIKIDENILVPKNESENLSAIEKKFSQSLFSYKSLDKKKCNLFSKDISNSLSLDNNDVPIQLKMFEPEKELDLEKESGKSLNSFIMSSDSLDNNCIIDKSESVDDILDVFEASTVSRNRYDLMKTANYGNIKNYDYMNTFVSSVGTNFEREQTFNGYYSDFFTVNKQIYNKCLIDSEKNETVYRAECYKKNRKSTEVSSLIHFFESGPTKNKHKQYFEKINSVEEKFEQLCIKNDVIPPPEQFKTFSGYHDSVDQLYQSRFEDTGSVYNEGQWSAIGFISK